MTYTTARHVTKTGKLSSQYNIVDDTGVIIGRCASRVSALTISQRLNLHVEPAIQNKLFGSFKTTAIICDERDYQTCGDLRVDTESTFIRDTIADTDNTRCVSRIDDSEKRFSSIDINPKQGAICEDVIGEQTNTSISEPKFSTETTISSSATKPTIISNGEKIEILNIIHQLKTNGDLLTAETNQFAKDAFKLTTESRQLATESRQLATESRQLTTESRQLATESRQLATESRQLATESRQLATESRQLATESRQLATDILSTANGLLSIAEDSLGIAVEAVEYISSASRGSIKQPLMHLFDEPYINVSSTRLIDSLPYV